MGTDSRRSRSTTSSRESISVSVSAVILLLINQKLSFPKIHPTLILLMINRMGGEIPKMIFSMARIITEIIMDSMNSHSEDFLMMQDIQCSVQVQNALRSM